MSLRRYVRRFRRSRAVERVPRAPSSFLSDTRVLGKSHRAIS
ncbi:hypothetical protein AS9A_3129 [Hoyosella subflava DQS3-9A1]|uniref:Uncharacterized protein n=1 Tax=Hoyosella subflava (strain DSM 45089 / JCM 17490 / NBRC 109087 / DQS3-9A1) TaxID=443218 RepID=F6EML6_HOYSD|nr:hypothetical protein AS9A_3129 [Hoyosella subflava DQS3-9A1]